MGDGAVMGTRECILGTEFTKSELAHAVCLLELLDGDLDAAIDALKNAEIIRGLIPHGRSTGTTGK